MIYDAFISYRRDNGFLMAQVIHDRLKDRGIKCFFDLEELRSGQFDEKILVAIQEAHSFILILPKNALNRCINEDDWVRKEILAAIKYRKTIIPVMYDGFRWPKKWNDDIPPEIRALENTNGVSGSKEYLPAMIEKIISYMPDLVRDKLAFRQNVDTNIPLDTIDFFEYALNETDEPKSVDMAFHAGADWRRSSAKVDLLLTFLNKRMNLRILANTTDVVGDITKSMTQPLKRYLGYEASLSEWLELESAYPEQVKVRIPSVPLLHRLYIVRGRGFGCANVKYYTYGNYTPEKDFRLSFGGNSKEFRLYSCEFDYLWQNSVEYIKGDQEYSKVK